MLVVIKRRKLQWLIKFVWGGPPGPPASPGGYPNPGLLFGLIARITPRGTAGRENHARRRCGHLDGQGPSFRQPAARRPDVCNESTRKGRPISSADARPEWIELEDAVVYRSTVSRELNCEVLSSELNQFWDAERKRSNLPEILICSEEPASYLASNFTHSTDHSGAR